MRNPDTGDGLEKAYELPDGQVSYTNCCHGTRALSYDENLFKKRLSRDLKTSRVQVITIGNERFRGPEPLFQPGLIGQFLSRLFLIINTNRSVLITVISQLKIRN